MTKDSRLDVEPRLFGVQDEIDQHHERLNGEIEGKLQERAVSGISVVNPAEMNSAD